MTCSLGTKYFHKETVNLFFVHLHFGRHMVTWLLFFLSFSFFLFIFVHSFINYVCLCLFLFYLYVKCTREKLLVKLWRNTTLNFCPKLFCNTHFTKLHFRVQYTRWCSHMLINNILISDYQKDTSFMAKKQEKNDTKKWKRGEQM